MQSLILYSTIYGHNLEMSHYIKKCFLPQANLTQIANFSMSSLVNYNILVICPGTYGEGSLLPTDEPAYNSLNKLNLAGLHFVVIAAGDQNFGPSAFANAANIFQYRLLKRKATPLTSAIKYDFDNLETAKKQVAKLFRENKFLRSADNAK